MFRRAFLSRIVAAVLLSLVFFLQGIAVAGAETVERKTLRVGVELDYPPFFFQDEEGNSSGFDFDIANALCRDLKRVCVILPMTFEDLLEAMKQGRLDIIVAGLAVKDDRLEYMNFSDSYYHSRSIYITAGSEPVTKAWMQGKRLGTQSGTAQQMLAETLWKDVAALYDYPDHQSMIDALKAGTLDVVIIDGLAAYDFLLSREGAAYTMQALPLDIDSPTNNACIGVRKDDVQLLKEINTFLNDIKLSSEYSRISRRYFPFSIY